MRENKTSIFLPLTLLPLTEIYMIALMGKILKILRLSSLRDSSGEEDGQKGQGRESERKQDLFSRVKAHRERTLGRQGEKGKKFNLTKFYILTRSQNQKYKSHVGRVNRT
jgi:hypothetical protein